MKYLLLSLTVIFALTSCINIKSPYTQVEYYRLTNEPFAVQKIDTIDASVQIRNLTISDEFDTEHIMTTFLPSKDLKVYYYSRWITKFDQLATDFLIARLNNYNIFSGGIVPSSSINLPNYILEGRITNLQSNNSIDNLAENNWSEVAINISFYKRSPLSPGLKQLFNRNYTQRINRQNNSIESIAPAISKAFSFVSDMMLVDIHNAIKNESDEGNKNN